ncbi:hypothetical protein H6P81_011741 [Aristolochia fimbriata]|uniref:Protein-tyrosine sulfotransferase n=2 Tax=Magnoliopsida TaxID=3398 RepID=A0AAV7E9Z5_ARIFI|nr:hypothetical protein H6P81_011741 [Aristolochia fimbriata]
MGMPLKEGKMEGWLYVIRSNRIGLQCSRKRFFVLEGNCLNSYKEMPVYKQKDPSGSAVIDSCIRVTDNGRVNINRKVLYMFTLYNVLSLDDHLKLGATSSEEAARWIVSFKEAFSKECTEQITSVVACSKRKRQSFRLNQRRGASNVKYAEFRDWTHCLSTHSDPMTSDVIAPSPWTIFGCQNGLRLFKERKDNDLQGKNWEDHPAIMAVGVVDATSETIFQTLMSLGLSRSEWDFCFFRGRVIDHLDGHTDIIHKQLSSDWLPWGMRRRDLLLRRYWRREDDGTYVILYHSVFHRNCLPKRGYIRACLKSNVCFEMKKHFIVSFTQKCQLFPRVGLFVYFAGGGYVISPVNQGKQSVVKHMLAMDWKLWKTYLLTSSGKSVTIKMLGRVAALRELFRAKTGSCMHATFNSCELTREIGLPQGEREDIKVEVQEENVDNQNLMEEQGQSSPNRLSNLAGSFLQLNDTTDEFFDVPEESGSDVPEDSWTSSSGLEMHSQDLRHGKLSTAANFVKKLHDLAVQKKGYMDLQETVREDSICCCYGTTLPKDQTCVMPCSWAEADPSTFLIRGNNYLRDHQKVKATRTLFQMVAADWLRSDKREDDLGGRPGSIVQKYAEQGGNEFFFIVNIQVPGSTTYSLGLYYMLDSPLEDIPLLDSFVKGDDAYRNSRFKLIPYISKGSWIVKQSVGKKACLLGQALVLNYFQGSNYLEIDVDVGSSTVARGVVSLVLGYLNNLVIEMAFLLQANTDEELPEALLGTCRINHLDASKSVIFLFSIFPDSSLREETRMVSSFNPRGLLLFLVVVCAFPSLIQSQSGLEQCETAVRKWANTALTDGPKGDKLSLRDLLFFLHIPRTGGRTYFHCFLRKLYTSDQECPRSYDKLRFDPSKPNCRLMVTHDDYSMTTKLPKQKTSVVTILRNPVDRVFSTYEFSVEVAARFLVHPNLTSATQMTRRVRSKSRGVSTLDIWPWKYLVPWMREDLFARRDARKHKNINDMNNLSDSYNMEDIVMPLHVFINDPRAHDIIHNGATFQVAGLTNNSCLDESHEVRHCVRKYPELGTHVLHVAKKRLDDMLYVGLTEDHKESATMFANMVGTQVLSMQETLISATEISSSNKSANSFFPVREPDSRKLLQSSINDREASKILSPKNALSTNGNMTVVMLMEAYEVCISSLRKSQANRRVTSLKRISPVNFTKEARRAVPEMVLEQILSLNKLDVELYKHAQDIFAQQQKHLQQKFVQGEAGERHQKNYIIRLGRSSWKVFGLAIAIPLIFISIFLLVTSKRRTSKIKV